MLIPPQRGISLILYLTIMITTMGVILAQMIERQEKPIYFVSKKFLQYETCYTPLEKTSLDIV